MLVMQRVILEATKCTWLTWIRRGTKVSLCNKSSRDVCSCSISSGSVILAILGFVGGAEASSTTSGGLVICHCVCIKSRSKAPLWGFAFAVNHNAVE